MDFNAKAQRGKDARKKDIWRGLAKSTHECVGFTQNRLLEFRILSRLLQNQGISCAKTRENKLARAVLKVKLPVAEC